MGFLNHNTNMNLREIFALSDREIKKEHVSVLTIVLEKPLKEIYTNCSIFCFLFVFHILLLLLLWEY